MEKTIISAERNNWFPNFKEIYRYRYLLVTLAWRDIQVKFAQTYVGLLWAFINPLVNLIILSFVFGKIAKIDTGEIPHEIFTITGLTAWTYFSTLLSDAGNSIVGSQAMIKKIYFPRLVIPLSKALVGLLDLGITILCLIIFMSIYEIYPGSNIIWLPVFILLIIISGLAGGILVSGLSVRYRDFSFVVPMLVRIGMFATPIAYSASLVPEKYKVLYYLNPMAGIVEGFRWSLLGQGPPDPLMIYSILLMLILFIFSLFFFSRIENKMADIL
ncbi:MAG: ABC transporter permease [Saprospiraceae bacterium]|nr:ABC transporter permease [Saprospiraceae bacterium]